MVNAYQKTIDLGDGREITIETGKLARQANGSVVVKMGRTMLLATVVSATEAREDVDFMPLSVEYKEKFASSGRFPRRIYEKGKQTIGLRNTYFTSG